MRTLDSFLSIPSVLAAVASSGDDIAVTVDAGASSTLYVIDPDEQVERVAADVATDVPAVWAGAYCYFLDADGVTIRRYDSASGAVDGTEVGNVSHLVGGLSGGRLAWVADNTELVAAPRDRLETSEPLVSGVQIPDRQFPVVDRGGERIAYASREDGELHSAVVTAAGRETKQLGESVIPFDIDGQRGELLVGSHPFAGAVGVYDLATDDLTWILQEEEENVPFPGIDRPVAFDPDPSTIHFRRMIDFVGRPAVTGRDGSVRIPDLKGYFDGSANNAPSGRFHLGDRLLVRETASNPGEVLTYVDGEATTQFECTSLPSSADEYANPERCLYSAVDGDGEMLVYRPESDPPYPTVVELYGGDRTIPARFDRFARYLVSKGFCYARVHNPDEPWSEAEHRNHARAAEHLADASFVDEARLVAYGFSMGGYDVRIQAVINPEPWCGGVALSGHSDLFAFDDAVGGSPEIRSQLGDPDEHRDTWERVSPVHRLDSVPDFDLALVDVEDDFIPRSRSLVDRYRECGATLGEDVRWTVIPGQEHNPRTHDERVHRYEVVRDFLFAVADA